jgi:hypothetical protein
MELEGGVGFSLQAEAAHNRPRPQAPHHCLISQYNLALAMESKQGWVSRHESTKGKNDSLGNCS